MVSSLVSRLGFGATGAFLTFFGLELQAHARVLFGVLLLSLLDAAASLLTPWFAGLFTQALLQEATGGFDLNIILVLWLALFGVQAVVRIGGRYLAETTDARFFSQLTSRIYDHLQLLPLAFHQDKRQGDTLTLMTSDALRVSGFFTGTLVAAIPMLPMFLVVVVIMVTIDPWIGVLAALLVPFTLVVLKFVGRQLRPLSSAYIDEWARMVDIAEENLSLLPVIKAFGREGDESTRYADRSGRVFDLARRRLKVQSSLGPLVQFLGASGVLALLWLSSSRVAEGALTTAQMVSLLLYGLILVRPMSTLANLWGQTQLALAAMDRMNRAFAEQPEPYQSSGLRLERAVGGICLEGVSFSYPNGNDVLNRVDLRIEPGETLALTGPNGAGKTTLAHLLLRLMDPSKGVICLDDRDIRDINLIDLRRQFGLVAQHVMLFNGTVAQNIAYGRSPCGRSEIENAASVSTAAEFIEQLPNGYDTVVGPQGVRLSGGQRQRLALARALLKNPPVLLLDEATAMFDPAGEQDLLKVSAPSLREKTVILITHRPAALQFADRVVHLDGGALTETRNFEPFSLSGERDSHSSG